MTLCSLCVRSHISVIVIQKGGKEIKRKVTEIKDEKLRQSNYYEVLDTFRRAMVLLQKTIEAEEEVIIELSNGTVGLWFVNGYAKPQYEDLFKEAYLALQRVPMTYTIIISKKPSSFRYASKKYVEKPLLYNGFDDIIETDEDKFSLEIPASVEKAENSDKVFKALDMNPSPAYADQSAKAEFEDDKLDFSTDNLTDKGTTEE